MTVSDAVTVSIDVPKELHIIGHQGTTIQELTQRTHTEILVPPKESPSTTISISGEPLAVASARKRILNLVGTHSTVGDQYRALAEQALNKRNEYYEEATEAYRRGDKEQAKHLSELGHQQDEKSQQFNTVAEEQIFRERNDARNEDEIDLHYLHKDEALNRLQTKLQLFHGDKLKVITGAGHHSEHGPVLKGAVMEFLDKYHYKYTPDGEGALIVETLERRERNEEAMPQPSWLERIVHRLCCCGGV